MINKLIILKKINNKHQDYKTIKDQYNLLLLFNLFLLPLISQIRCQIQVESKSKNATTSLS